MYPVDTTSAPTDDALRLVQAQYEVSGTIFSSESPVDILRAIDHFLDGHFADAHLGIIDADTPAGQLHIVARVEGGQTSPADELIHMSDYPASEMLAALEALAVPDVETDQFLMEHERQRLHRQGARAVVIVPLVVSQRLSGLVAFTHPQPVTLSAARLRALRNLADQLAVVVENRRLLAESQARAQREQKASEIANNLIAATDVRSLLDMAAAQFNEALGAVYTRITLQPDDARGDA